MIDAIAIVGPTASGKSALGAEVAARVGGEVVNFDSLQIYRDFDLGTAKPSAAELARVRHHLIGVADAAAPWTAGEYARRARPVIEEIAGRQRTPILVGGTGFYLRALVEGLSSAPPASPALRERLRARDSEQRLHRLLTRLDPASAARIAPADRAKLIRALEVRILTGQTLDAWWRAHPAEPWNELRLRTFVLYPDRAQLYARIDRRAEAMFRGGIQEETRRLLGRYPEHLRIWTAHGYKQACDIVLRGAPVGAALAEAQQEQRRYAKRQWTWFGADPGAEAIAGFGDEPETAERVLSRL